jgi:ketosteroid isomerase-like protein
LNRRLIAVCTAAAVCIGVFFMLRGNDTRRIKKRLAGLEKNLTVEGGGSMIALAAKINAASSLFTPDCTVTFTDPGFHISGRQDLQAHIAAALKSTKSFSVSFHDITVYVDGETASAELTATARSSGYEGIEAREVEMELVKTEDGWLILSVRDIPTFR